MRIRHLFILLAVLAGPALAGPVVPSTQTEMTLSFAPVVRTAAPAVVNIYASRIVEQSASPFASDPFFSQFFNFGPTTPRVQNSLGSGVILRGDGIVVSNYHVVGGAEEIRVVLADRREFAAEVMLADAAADLAILKLTGAGGLPALALADSDHAEVGDLVLAIGNPFGVGQTVTTGIVSGLARAGTGGGGGAGQGIGYFIQTDAAINPGNSGGALVDMDGKVLGINTSILTRSGGSNGIGFAIPSNLVAQYVAQAEAGNRQFAKPWAGIDVQEIDADLAAALGLPAPQGVAIRQIHPQSPFSAAGMRPGDVITALDGLAVDGPQELGYRLAVIGPGVTVPVTYWRDGAEGTAEVALAEAPGSLASRTQRISGDTAFAGLAVAALDPAMIDRLGLRFDVTGVVVTEVAGRAARTRLQPGDVILALNGEAVASPDEFAAIAGRPDRSWKIEFLRGGRRVTLRFSGG
ncbi:MAG: trypsin-like peptidase domain-containing protein [Rhodobacteraceae bacterium]|nr:trypsin-like peptidase domain-containing protein [Paracoccaceae bacterium]